MSPTPPADESRSAPSVFLSYASEDRPAAQNLRETLLAYGLDPWYDESGLDGGDAWDQKIRRQIRECNFFMPLISAHSEARPEGYFRREWRLAVERTLDMADDHTFLLPVVLDDTTQAGARVPERFLSVQWVRAPDGKPTPALEALCRRLLSGKPAEPTRSRPVPPADAPRSSARLTARSTARSREYPPFPRQEAGQKVRFWFQVAGWGLQSAWTFFTGLPRWVQIGVYVWLAIALMSRSCVSSDERSEKPSRADTRPARELPGNAVNLNDTNVTGLGTQIAQAVTAEVGDELGTGRDLLAIPFGAPPDDPAAQKLAASTFASVYGRVGLSHRGQLGVTKRPLRATDPAAALALGRARHAKYVLYGAVDQAQNLSVNIVSVVDGSLLWSHSYAASDADPVTQIVSEVDSRVSGAKN
jgi:TIR domain